MWSLEDYKIIFLLVSLGGILIISSPMLPLLIPSQTSEQFSELYILGSNHMAEDYPFNIEAGITYTIYPGIANHMGTSSYYLLNVKMRNRNESLHDSTLNMPSSLSAIADYRVFLGDGEIWEKTLNFSIQNVSLQGDYCLVKTLSIDGLAHDIENMIAWDQENAGYFVELLFELWIFDTNTKTLSFQNHWLGIWLNITCNEKY